jgi:hypothetical protein
LNSQAASSVDLTPAANIITEPPFQIHTRWRWISSEPVFVFPQKSWGDFVTSVTGIPPLSAFWVFVEPLELETLPPKPKQL